MQRLELYAGKLACTVLRGGWCSNALSLPDKECGGQTVFASVHDVKTEGGIASIKAGTPVSKTGLVNMMQTLVPENYAPAELLGSHILAKGGNYLAWYCKPQKREVWFKCAELGEGEITAKTNHPGLVFIIRNEKWCVFAVKGNKRPTSNTPLFVAPYLNVWKGGHICTGNIDTPKGELKFSTEAWEEAFFRSFFTHPNQHEKGALTKYRGGIFPLWRALMKGRAFPTESLVAANETLGQVFERVVGHGQS